MSPEDFLKLEEKNIVIYPNDILTTKAKPITDFTLWNEVCQAMLKIMTDNAGIGLAAPQVGLPYRMFVIGSTKELFYFNPEILAFGDEEEEMLEGCLSLPKEMFKVKRPKKIKVKWQDMTGKINKQTYEGYTARVFQHEYDHIEGKLINGFVNTI